MDAQDGATAIGHQTWCDTGQHTDPAVGCSSPTVDTHGLITHIAGTPDGCCVFAEPRAPRPLVLTAAACLDIAAQFSHLGHLLHG